MHGINKLECYISLGRKSSPGTRTLAYLAYSKVSKKLNCCKYVPDLLSNIRLGLKMAHATKAISNFVQISVMKKNIFLIMTPAYCVYMDKDYEERGKN